MQKPKNVTPAMAQFYDIKEQYPDSILFFGWVIFMKCLEMMLLQLLKY